MNAATTARTNNQSAAIALLAAASAKPAAQSPRDDSFAQALSSVNQSSSKGEAGLFAARQTPTDAKPKAKTADDPAASTTKSNAADTTQPAETDANAKTPTTSEPGDTSAATAKTKTAEPAATQQLAASDIPTETPLLPVEAAISAVDTPLTTADRKPIKSDRANAATAQGVASATSAPAAEATTEVAASPTSAASEADDAVTPAATKRAPTDPLRLIQPSEQSPVTRENAIASKSNDAAATNPDAPIATRQPNQNAGNDRNANTPAPQAFGLAQPGKTVPQSPIAGTGTTGTGTSTIGGSITSNTNTSTIGAPRVDSSVVPPRLPGGRAPETPITLKLTARSLPTGEPGTTQTEADAAATQIARGLGAAFRNKGGQLTLWMNPESLGKLRVQMTIDNGTISARFEATSEATKNLLTQNVDALRSALESRGLSASSIEIVSIPDWSRQNNQPDTPGYKAAPGEGSPNQPGTNHNSSGQQFSHQGSARDDMPPKLHWLREPELANATSSPRNEPAPQINVNERMLAMTARLEVDAIA